jgi:hypothetical protein
MNALADLPSPYPAKYLMASRLTSLASPLADLPLIPD